jgi:5-formyltetrahydrofolate cyclo-ligase
VDKRRLQASKQSLRNRVWSLLEHRGVGRFPFPLDDRIPNFQGAAEAAARLSTLPEWRAARRLKCNPDAPQRAVRLRALREGKDVYVAVPRLAEARCFLHLDPRRLGDRLAAAATIGGAATLGVPVGPADVPHIDLVVAGSVAVNRRGARVGKGGGYSDLEFALARELGAVDARTCVVTTVHDLQVVGEAIPMTSHDVPVDVIVTPTRVLRCARARRRPRRIEWAALSPSQLAAMPALARLRTAGGRESSRRRSGSLSPGLRRG